MKIFNDWYDIYSTDGKMHREDCSRFIKGVTNNLDDIPVDDSRIVSLFNQFDREEKGYIDREGYLKFYRECTLSFGKQKTVWENLNAMGYRNDLKMYNEPLEIYNDNKTILPRYTLSHNEEFFNALFALQDQDESIAKEAFRFLCLITTNPQIYKDILFLSESNEKINWNKILDSSNIYKLIYVLQIIESFLEDIDIDNENIDSFVDEENLLDLKNKDKDYIRNLKTKWMRNFVQNNGYQHLFDILVGLLQQYKDSTSFNLMRHIYLELVLKILKVFYSCALNKYNHYIQIYIPHGNSTKESSTIENLFKSELTQNIINKEFNYTKLAYRLLDLLIFYSNHRKNNIKEKDKAIFSQEEIAIIENSFEFLTLIVGFEEDISQIYDLMKSELMTEVILFGITNSCLSIRVKFTEYLIKLCKVCEYSNRISIFVSILSNMFDLVNVINNETIEIDDEIGDDVKLTYERKLSNRTVYMSKEGITNYTDFFDFFCSLLEIYVLSPAKYEEVFSKNSINVNGFVMNLARIVNHEIYNEGQPNLSSELTIGYLKILKIVMKNLLNLKSEICSKYKIMQGILTRILFKQNKAIKETLNNIKFINPDKLNDSNSNKSQDNQLRNACYDLIIAILNNSIECFDEFLDINVLEAVKQVKNDDSPSNPAHQSTSAQAASSRWHMSSCGKRENHVGIRNLGCICYMNSMLQQFFMVPSFRYGLLQVDDFKIPECNNSMKIDDNVLHQVQRMFSYLELSEREDYNPQGFCFSFKDLDGMPVNTSYQQDSQEFLNRFLEKIENHIKPTPYRYLLNSVFGGKTCSQLLCEQGCGSASNKFEDFFNLSLEVANQKTLYDSLGKFIAPERIDDYFCEKCQKKVAITKRNSLAELPNVLIVHLQRIFYNYEYDRNEKINSRLEFPRILNLKNYCIEELMKKSKSSENRDEEGEETSKNNEDDEIYSKSNDYYEYHLVGVNVHLGSADSGHYISFINTIRTGNHSMWDFDPSNETHQNSWLKFNDSHVSKFK